MTVPQTWWTRLIMPAGESSVEMYGPAICPNSRYHNRDLDFRLTQISDCAPARETSGIEHH